jgi:YD repeat-containing protein
MQCHSGSGTLFANNQLIGYSAACPELKRRRDAAGNMLSDGIHHYTYDAENRLISVDNGATTYTYDAQGRRVTKISEGAWRITCMTWPDR